MNRIANESVRPYHSQLRAEQAGETRARILDATLRVMATGIASVSVPDVAREAGVSVPTVYRHFAAKRDLLAAVYPHLMQRAGLDEVVGPRSMGNLRDGVYEIFERVDRLQSLDELARAAMVNPAAEEARRVSMPRRLAMARGLTDTIEPQLAKADRERIARLLVVLTTSAALRVWRDHLESSVDEAADDVDWVIRSAIAGAASRRRR
jgi:AcrR family transcriptional regulator